MKNRNIALLFLTICFVIFCCTLSNNYTVQASQTDVYNKLTSLHSKFPDGKYWNHYVNSENQMADSLGDLWDESFSDTITSHPCNSHGIHYTVGMWDDNFFDGAYQCCGFGKKIFYEVFGQRVSSLGTRSDRYNISVGDFVHINNGTKTGHYGIVFSITGNYFDMVECNKGGTCIISWGGTAYNMNTIEYFVHASNYDSISTAHDPTMCLDAIQGGMNTLYIKGWAFDADDTSQQLPIHVYMDGPAGTGTAITGSVVANVYRNDVNNVYGCGDYHGFEATVPISYSGTHTFYVYACNIGGGDSVYKTGTATVTADAEAPVISDIKVTNIDSTGYTVSCKVTDNIGVTRVAFPTFSPVNGNALWKDGTQNGDTWSFRVSDSDHQYAKGSYTTHIYAYDDAGNSTGASLGSQTVTNTGNSVTEIIYNGHQYLLYDDYLTWQDAKAFCESKGGHLVTITSAEEEKAVLSLISHGARQIYNLGLTDESSEGNFSWITGETVNYTNWYSGEPNNDGGNENYGWIYVKDDQCGWNDYEGDIRTDHGIGYILEIDNAEISPAATATYQGNQYALYNAVMTWNEAKAFCEAQGGHLATITSSEEQGEVANLIASGANNQMSGYYIGLERNSSNNFEWITGEELSYSNWASGQPDNCGNIENKGALYYNCQGNATYTWNDFSETGNTEGYTIGFICETDVNSRLLGDINADGAINSTDALQALRHSVKEITLVDDAFTRGDVVTDGVINSTDALQILRYSVKEISSF